MNDKTYGSSQICGWMVNDQEARIETREPTISKTLDAMPGFKRTGFGVSGGFLRIYSANISYKDMQRVVDELQEGLNSSRQGV